MSLRERLIRMNEAKEFRPRDYSIKSRTTPCSGPPPGPMPAPRPCQNPPCRCQSRSEVRIEKKRVK